MVLVGCNGLMDLYSFTNEIETYRNFFETIDASL